MGMTDPTVVLVSVGADSAVLIDEIERKGLRVVSCPFAEAEEAIEREKPLLVVLHGARGAVELSTMLEDADDPPQVAVVASRSELGTLMGLNREIVVSLLATELTEKTVAVRLEGVARQRAKTLGLNLNLAARRMSLGPRPNLSRPAPRPASESKAQNLVLQAPTPDLQGAPKFRAPEPPAIDAPPPPSRAMPAPAMPAIQSRAMAGSASRAMQPPADEGRPPPRPPRVSSGTSIGLPSPGRPDPGPPPRRPPSQQTPTAPEAESSVLSASLLLSDIPLPDATAPIAAAPPRPAPPRPTAARSPIDPQESTIESDAPTAVISLTPSVIESLGPHEGLEAARPIAPGAPPVPRFEPSELLSESGLDESVGPDLKAALSLDRPNLSALGGPPPSTSGPIAPGLPEMPSLPEDSPSQRGADRTEPFALATRQEQDDDDELALPLLRASRPPEQSADDFSTQMLTEVTMPAIPGSLAAEALAEARLRSEPNHPIPEPPEDMPDPEEDRATVTGAAPSGSQSPRLPAVSSRPLLGQPPALAAPSRPRGKGLIAACAAIAALGGGAAYVTWGLDKPPTKSASKESSSTVSPATTLAIPSPVTSSEAAPSVEPPDYGDPDAPEAAPMPSGTPAEPAPTDTAPTDSAPSDAASAAEPAPEAPTESEPPPSDAPSDAAAPSDTAAVEPAAAAAPTSTEPAVLLDNPFATPDANLPGCEQLVPGARPATPDPVLEASQHWAAARKSIVKGDIEGASRSMCLAVAVNPQSPAVEGLARLYTLSHSPTQALVWVERAMQLAPANRELMNLRGDAKSQLGRQDEATLDWLEAMGIAPDETKRRANQAAEYANIARTEKGRSDLAKAEQFYRRALGFEETNLVALTGLAELLLARKLYDQAGSFAVKALAVFEPVPEAYLVLGDVALAKNDPARARASFERALAIRPDFWPAKTRLRDLPK